ncbi:hypothetical protein [Pedobacter cryoconitis]|uniref:Uncharacterized protein n=1 Tax=Pedobacter cryoconitis TaxID=188932 RepID=A0A7X0MLM0_9SPHI|nr:hypothetical protein [Pedobacter cryoconitis]MBB6501995.1 hypothetical protein [Pedobacter cryoconitis]
MKTGKILAAVLKFLLILTIIFGLHGRTMVRYADVFSHRGESVEQSILRTPLVGAKIIHCRLLCFTQDFQSDILPPVAYNIGLIPPALVVLSYRVLYTIKSPSGHHNRLLPLRAPPYC